MWNKKLLIACLGMVLLFSSCSKFQNVLKKGSVDEKYNAAISYYERKDYYRAGLLLEELIPLIRGQKRSEIANLYYAYCHFYQRQLQLAAYYFKRFYTQYGASKYVEEAMYMYAFSLYRDSPVHYLDQSNTDQAIAASQNFLNRFPQSKYTEECNRIITELRRKLETKAYEGAKLYYKIRNYKAAVITFDNFQKDFPDSNYNEEVAYLKILAQYEYAEISTRRRQEKRYNEVVKLYTEFIDAYPESGFKRAAEKLYSSSIRSLEKLKKISKKS
ncbi:MAG TPA: outer membrane protein assembly factor BamD [Microscillaceae bacterium]|nr:outer membrane protein assembly factor BamD [Microscillaceae bacterium]